MRHKFSKMLVLLLQSPEKQKNINSINSITLQTTVLFAIAILAFFIFGVIIYLNAQQDKESTKKIDELFENNLSKVLSKKLFKPTEDILQALVGSSNNETTAMIREVVDSATLIFTRSSSSRNVTISLHLKYRDTSTASIETTWDWDQLPKTIRNEFIRSSSSQVERPWVFPWSE